MSSISKFSYVRLGDGRRGRLAVQTARSRIAAGLHGGPSLLGQFLQILVAFLPHFDPFSDVAHGGVFYSTRKIKGEQSSLIIQSQKINLITFPATSASSYRSKRISYFYVCVTRALFPLLIATHSTIPFSPPRWMKKKSYSRTTNVFR